MWGRQQTDGVCTFAQLNLRHQTVQLCTIQLDSVSPDHHLLELCKGDLTGSVEVGLPEKYFQIIATLRFASPEDILDETRQQRGEGETDEESYAGASFRGIR